MIESIFWIFWLCLLVFGVIIYSLGCFLEHVSWKRTAYDLEVDGEPFEKVRYEVDHKHKEITIYDENGYVTVLPYQRYSEKERYKVTRERIKEP